MVPFEYLIVFGNQIPQKHDNFIKKASNCTVGTYALLYNFIKVFKGKYVMKTLTKNTGVYYNIDIIV